MATIAKRSRFGVRGAVMTAAAVALLAGMALDTHAVRIGSSSDQPAGVFVPAAFGKSEFPKVQAAVVKRAVDASVLAAALAKDQDAAVKQYGLATETGSEMSVRFTGVVGKGEFGVYDVAIPDVPANVHVSVQTGPAIDGTSLRDGSGLIGFGQFRNQIDFQNAGAALNVEMKKEVLARIDTDNLSGKTIRVVGVFDLSDPADWEVTPVQLDVQ